MQRKGSREVPRTRTELDRHLRDDHGWTVVCRTVSEQQLNRHHNNEHRFAQANHNHKE